MKLRDYLGRRMKDDEVMRLLERFHMQVIYQFDRQHENTADYYDSMACDGGFALRFDNAQVLTAIFCYLIPSEGFQPVEGAFIGVPLYGSSADARAAAMKLSVSVSHANDVKFLGRVMSWVRLDHPSESWHFEYCENVLTRVSLVRRHGAVA